MCTDVTQLISLPSLGACAFIKYIPAAPGLPPEDTRVEVHDAHSVTVSWSPPSSEQNGPITGYMVNLTQAYVNTLPTQHFSNSTSIYLDELKPYSTYHIQVAAVTIATGPYSDRVYTLIPEAGTYSNCSSLLLILKITVKAVHIVGICVGRCYFEG